MADGAGQPASAAGVAQAAAGAAEGAGGSPSTLSAVLPARLAPVALPPQPPGAATEAGALPAERPPTLASMPRIPPPPRPEQLPQQPAAHLQPPAAQVGTQLPGPLQPMQPLQPAQPLQPPGQAGPAHPHPSWVQGQLAQQRGMHPQVRVAGGDLANPHVWWEHQH